MLFAVAVATHAYGLAMLDGRACTVVASHLCKVHLAILTRTDLLKLAVWLDIIYKTHGHAYQVETAMAGMGVSASNVSNIESS